MRELETAGQLTDEVEAGDGLLRKRFIGAEAAGYLIYHAVVFAWLLVAA